MEVKDAFGGEAGNLLARGTIEWLHPQVVSVAGEDGIGDRFAIVGKANGPLSWPPEIEGFYNMAASVVERNCSHHLAIGRDIKSYDQFVGNYLRSAAFEGNFSEFVVIGGVVVKGKTPIGRADGIDVQFSVGKLFQIPAAGIHAPHILTELHVAIVAPRKDDETTVGAHRRLNRKEILPRSQECLGAGVGIDPSQAEILIGDDLAIHGPTEIECGPSSRDWLGLTGVCRGGSHENIGMGIIGNGCDGASISRDAECRVAIGIASYGMKSSRGIGKEHDLAASEISTL